MKKLHVVQVSTVTILAGGLQQTWEWGPLGTLEPGETHIKFHSTPSFLRGAHRGLESSVTCLWELRRDGFSLERQDQESGSENQKQHSSPQDAGMRGVGFIGSWCRFIEGWGGETSASFGTRVLPLPGLSFRFSVGFFFPGVVFSKLEVVL